MEHCGQEGYAIYHAIKKWRHYLEDAEVLLKSDAKSLQKFLNGKTDNLKLHRWSLEPQGRNIKVEHIRAIRIKLLIVSHSYPLLLEEMIIH